MNTTGQEPARAVEYARAYAEMGLPVFPVHTMRGEVCSCANTACRVPGKHPATKRGALDATTCPDRVAAMWNGRDDYNVGIATGGAGGLVAVDVDADRGGVAAFERVRALLPPTATQTTGAGGFHLLYRLPAGVIAKNGANIKRAEEAQGDRLVGVDIRGQGGYIVAPPSVHRSGRQYTWRTTPDTLAEMPMAFLQRFGLIREPNVADVAGGAANVASVAANVAEGEAVLTRDDLADIQRALRFIAPEERDNWLKVGMALHSTGHARAQELWNEWSATTTRNNYSFSDQVKAWRGFGQRSVGPLVQLESLFHLAHEGGYSPDDFEGLQQFSNEPLLDGQRVSNDSGETLPTLPTLPEQRHEVPIVARRPRNLLAVSENPPTASSELHLWRGATITKGSTVLLAGAPKVGKSGFVLEFCVAAASGTKWLGEDFVRPLRVCWLNAELGESFAYERLEAAANRIADPVARQRARQNICYTYREPAQLSLSNERECRAIEAMLTPDPDDAGGQVLPYDVVVFDPFINWCDAEENSSAEIKAILQKIERVVRSGNPDAVVFLVHHTRKSGGIAETPSFDMIRGSGAFRGYYDTGMLMFRDPNTAGGVRLLWETRNTAGPAPMTLTRNAEHGGFDAVPDTYDAGAGMQSAVADYMPESDDARADVLADWIREAKGRPVPIGSLIQRGVDQFMVSKNTIQRNLRTAAERHPDLIRDNGAMRSDSNAYIRLLSGKDA